MLDKIDGIVKVLRLLVAMLAVAADQLGRVAKVNVASFPVASFIVPEFKARESVAV